MCSYQLLDRSLYTDVDYRFFRLSNQDRRFTVGKSSRKGMFTTLRHLIPPLKYPGLRVCPAFLYIFFYRIYETVGYREMFPCFLCLITESIHTANISITGSKSG